MKEKSIIQKKLEEVRDGAADKLRKTSNWMRENIEMVKVMAPVGIAVVGGVVKIVYKLAKDDRAHREKDLKELYCYDRKLGHYWKLARALSSKDWMKINERKKNGENLGDILYDMDVLE